MYSFRRCKNLTYLCGTATDPVSSKLEKAENGNLRKFGSTISHGTEIAPKQSLYQKEATGMESPKFYSFRRCKKLHLPVRYCKRPPLK